MPPIENFGKILIIAGVLIAVVGLVLVFGAKFGLGKLPGDIFIKKGNSSFYFPVVTSLVISIVISIIINIFFRR